MILGVVSDTHDYFDPRLHLLFAGVSHILHAGDVGSQRIIAELESIAPVTAVRGNTDTIPSWRETEIMRFAGRKFLLHHIIEIGETKTAIARTIAREGPDLVAFGHSHKPLAEKSGETLYLNPGYAGRPRFDLPRSVALVHLSDSMTIEFKALD